MLLTNNFLSELSLSGSRLDRSLRKVYQLKSISSVFENRLDSLALIWKTSARMIYLIINMIELKNNKFLKFHKVLKFKI